MGTLRQAPRFLAAAVILAVARPALADPSGEPAPPPPVPSANPVTGADPFPLTFAPPRFLARADEASCPGSGDAIAVLTRKRELWLCTGGAPAARYEVALGQAGTGKERKGDRRTPVGTYALGKPRPSARFGIFIPIAYPTPEQAAQGHTGGDVGIHGPPRRLPEPGYPSTAYDWTLGCVATGSDADVEAIAEFVRVRQPVVVIR